MARLFGTDGIRGIANEDITIELAMNVGRATATVLTQGRRRRPLFLIGRDTRISSDMLESALCAGLCSVGADVISLGSIATPAVPFLMKQYKADAGIMISASHNPYPYNGIKIFGDDGFKLPDDLETRIESLVLDNHDKISPPAPTEEVGTRSFAADAPRRYIEHLKSTVPTSLEGLCVAVDCANGSASKTAPILFEELGIEAHFLSTSPNGFNINENCGSTHLENLKKFVLDHQLDAGIAFDGDADRCLCVDEMGNEIDGDFIMAICALDMKQRGKLRRNAVVGTIMTNMGFQQFCKDQGIHFIATKVGDRYVLEEMEMEGYCFGGEQSGHVIFRDFATTGDGQLTAIQLLCHMLSSGKKLSELAKVMTPYPQVTKNIPVTPEGKLLFYTNDVIKKVIQQQKDTLGDRGRVVVRVSGTEPLIRVMVEGKDEPMIQTAAKKIVTVLKKELN